jgi:hypothetical protein
VRATSYVFGLNCSYQGGCPPQYGSVGTSRRYTSAMPITIDVHQGDRTATAMLVATISLALAAIAQVVVACMQALAANRQAKAADRQVEATDRAICAAKELEDNRTMPILAVTIGPSSDEDMMPLRITNEGAGPALRIAVGWHEAGSTSLDRKTQFPLSKLSLIVSAYLEVSVSKNKLTPERPLFIHCHSAQRTEIIYQVIFKPDGRLSVLRKM